MTAAERTLLLALFRWGRAEGWARWRSGGESGWASADDLVSVSRTGEGIYVSRGRLDHTQCETTGVVESIDVLAALGIVPARFSSAYRAGWDAMSRYATTAHYGDEYRAIRPVVKS